MDRQKLRTITQEGVEVQAMELSLIQDLRGKICARAEFQRISPRQQKQLLGGDWKVASGTSELAVAAGFHGTYFDNVYRYLCGYSHASYISVVQVAQATTFEDQASLTRTAMDIGTVILAHFARSYPKQFPETQAVLDVDPKIKTLVDRWAIMADRMSAIYGSEGV